MHDWLSCETYAAHVMREREAEIERARLVRLARGASGAERTSGRLSALVARGLWTLGAALVVAGERLTAAAGGETRPPLRSGHWRTESGVAA